MGSRVKRILNQQKAFLKKIGRFQSALLLTVFYYTIFGAVALLRKCVKKDPLDVKWEKKDSYWLERETVDLDIEKFERQF